jgi:hypothetical protein
MDLVLGGAVVTDEAGPPGLVLDGVLRPSRCGDRLDQDRKS